MEPIVYKIYRLLEGALQADTYHDIRQRLASEEQWKVEEPSITNSMKDMWIKAKALICENKDEVDKWIAETKSSNPKSSMLESIDAAVRTIEEEMAQRMENVITEDDNG